MADEAVKPPANLMESADRFQRFVADDGVSMKADAPEQETTETETDEQPKEAAPSQEIPPEQADKSEAQEGEESQSDEGPPDEFDAFAKAFDMTPEELAQHVKVKVKVDGLERQVPLHEALNGYQRDEDYQRKMTAMADQKRQFDAAVEKATQLYQSQFQRLNSGIETLEAQLAKRDDAYWQELLERDSQAYLREKAADDRQRALLAQAQTARDQAAVQAQAQSAQKIMEYRAEQQKKLAAVFPELAKPEGAQKFDAELRASLTEYGFSEDEVKQWMAGPWDHRQVLLARDAMKYRALKKANPEVTAKLKSKPKVLKPGASTAAGDRQNAGVNQLRARLKKTGDIKTAGKLFERFA